VQELCPISSQPVNPKILTKTRIAILLAVPLAGLIVFLAVGLGPSPLTPRPLHVRASGPLGNGWQKYDLITSPGDWDQTANRAPDVIARAAGDGSVWLFSGDGLGGYSGPTRIATGWGSYTKLFGVGDFKAHNSPKDLMAVRSNGELVLIPNLGHGVIGTPRVLGPGFGGYDVILGAGDFNGDGTEDVIARSAGDGTLTLYAGDGKGGFSGHRLISPASFSGYSLLTTPGDWDNDNYPDIVARSPDGMLCLFRGNGRGGLQNTTCIPIGTGWNAFNAIVAPGVWNRDNQVDLLARTPYGGLWLATGAGITGYSDPLSLTQCSTIGLHISSVTSNYTITFQRYGQAAPQTMATLSESNGRIQTIPADAGRDGAKWPETVSYSDTCAWKSGLYAAKLTAITPVASTGASLNEAAYITFVVKPLTPPTARQLLVVASTNTWNAYNDWPQDSSFYDRKPGGRATQVSYLRPNPGATPLAEGSHIAGGELQVLKWLEAHSFAYQMITDIDMNDSSSLLSTSNYYGVLLNTHSEYWTDPMYDAVARYLQNGGSLLTLSGNTMYRKETLAKPSQSAQWSSLLVGGVNPLRSPFAIGNLIGLQFVSTIDTCAPYRVTKPRSWLMAGVKKRIIGVTGQYWPSGCFLNAPGIPPGASGRETDKTLPFLLNRRYEVVAVGTNPNQRGADLVWYMRRDGGQVVNVGSIAFGNSLAIDPNLSIIVTNALDRFMRFHDSGQSSFGGLIAPGDWDGDGRPDLLARRGDNLYLYRANGVGPVGNPTFIGKGWAQYNLIAAAGTWMGHTRPDLFARRASDGALFVAPNNGFGSVNRRVRIGASVHWSNYDTIQGVGDWNGDDIPDLIARTPGGDLYLYTGLGGGRINPIPTLLATGWDAFDQIISPVDWNGDGLPDVIARKPDGTMWISLGRRDHTLAASQEMPDTNGFDRYSTVLSGGDWNGNGLHDLVARRADGTIWVYPGNGESVGGPFLIAQNWNVYS
jgi:hypothetical protein